MSAQDSLTDEDRALSEQDRPAYRAEQEVRFAVVMYGGVSLAVYINGVAQELFRLVRATAPQAGDDPQRVCFTGEDLDGSELAYRELGQILGAAGAPLQGAAAGDPVRTRFVVDILSGTSAGGINGILLAKALANGEDFRPSANLWLEVAGIDELLYEDSSFADLPAGTPRESVAPSLLNGYRLYWKLREAMKGMTGTRPAPESAPRYAEQIDLAVPATDLAGLPLPIQLGDGRPVTELQHRQVFHFSSGTRKATGEDHNDFEGHADLMLGFSARATSSFPGAFEPVRLEDLAPLDQDEFATEDWARWFTDDGTEPEWPGFRFFADGGYLDNKPFSYATMALRRRHADVPVSRRLLFIEPDPAPEPCKKDDTKPPRPSVYANVADGLLLLPRYETIREDVAEVGRRNVVVDRLRRTEKDALDAMAGGGPNPLAALQPLAAEATDAEITAALGPVAPLYRAYAALRLRIELDVLAELAAGLASSPGDATGEIRSALRGALRSGWQDGTRAFLESVDAGFAQRRLSFLQDRINEQLRDGARDAGELRALKRGLNAAFDALRRAERAPGARDPSSVLDPGERARLAELERLADSVATDLEAADGFLKAAQAYFARPIAEALAGIAEALATRTDLAALNDRFETFDMLVLPLAYPDLGEANVVDIRRVSPRDALGIMPRHVDDPVEKLAGVRYGHFGAFLEGPWRVNDLLWGRLDAAQGIIDAVLPDSAADQRDRLRTQAHAAILQEARRAGQFTGELAAALEQAEDDDEATVNAFKEIYRPPEQLDTHSARELARRALTIAGPMLAKPLPAVPAWIVRRLASLGRVVVRFVRL